MNKIEILHIPFTIQDMDCLSEEEKIFFFQIGALLQEVISLQKYVHMSSHGVTGKWERAAENAQAMYFFRLLAGTLFEAWKTLQSKRYRVVKAKYKPKLEQIALEADKKLSAYFGNSNNLCEKIRNNYSHHYNYGEIQKLIRRWPSGEKLDLILAEHHANCRYLASDTLISFAIIGIADVDFELKKYLSEVLGIADIFIELAGNYVSLILKLIQNDKSLYGTKLVIGNTPRLDDVRLNYFLMP